MTSSLEPNRRFDGGAPTLPVTHPEPVGDGHELAISLAQCNRLAAAQLPAVPEFRDLPALCAALSDVFGIAVSESSDLAFIIETRIRDPRFRSFEQRGDLLIHAACTVPWNASPVTKDWFIRSAQTLKSNEWLCRRAKETHIIEHVERFLGAPLPERWSGRRLYAADLSEALVGLLFASHGPIPEVRAAAARFLGLPFRQ